MPLPNASNGIVLRASFPGRDLLDNTLLQVWRNCLSIKNKTILIGNTNRIRDFIYIDDFLGIFERVIQNSFPGIFNVGSGKGNSIRDIFDICKEITGLERQVIFDPTKLRDEHDYPKVIADISLAKRTFDWEPKIDIKSGISKMITWYRSYES